MVGEQGEEIGSKLNGLIQGCHDAEEAYRRSAAIVKDPEIRTLFQNYSSRCAGFALQLEAEAARIGVMPKVSSVPDDVWNGLKSATAENNEQTILEEAEGAESAAMRDYRDTLSLDLPSDARTLIARQYRDIQQMRNQIRELRESGRSTPAAGSPAPRGY
jgi:uncharacterized protein (TIGR02284 family)